MQEHRLPQIKLPARPNYIRLGQEGDIYEIFKSLEQENEACFLLESLGEESYTSRYSIVGFSPEKIFRANGNTLTINGESYKVKNPYYALRNLTPQNSMARDYVGGLVGYIGYDAMSYFEESLRIKEHEKFDQFMFGFFQDGIVFDKMTGEVLYFYYTKSRLQKVKKWIKNANAKKTKQATVKDIHANLTKKQHRDLVQKILEEVKAGNTFQCQLGIKMEFKITGDTLSLYTQLRKINPSPYMYYLKFGDIKIIGASPELLFRLRQGEMETYPLAGTIARGKTKKQDQSLAQKLLTDQKELAEHRMLVDLHRNDLGRIARFGTVKVRNLMDIKKYSHVQHISSEVVGIMRYNEDMFSGLASVFPAGTLTGAPKIESMKIINRLEPDARGPYGGVVGHFGFNTSCTFPIAIRSLFISGSYGFTQASGGIVYDSNPQKEYEELQNKLAAMKRALEPFVGSRQRN